MNTLLNDLNENQYEDLYHIDDAPLTDLRIKALSRMGWWAVFLVLAGTIAGFVVVLPNTIPAPFTLKSERAEDIYRFPGPVYIEKRFVQSGQKVRAGDVLLEISAPDIAALTQELASAQASLSTFKRYRTASASHERTVLGVTIRRIREDIALKESQLVMNEQKWAAEAIKLSYDAQEATRQLTINRQFYRDGDISKNDLNAVEARQVQAKSQYDIGYQTYLDTRSTLERQLASQRLEISGLEKQIAKNSVDQDLEGAQLSSTITATRNRIEGAYGTFEVTANNHLQLKASRNSTVSFAFEGDKEVPAGSILLKLLAEEAPLYAHTQVNSSQIGKIQEGLPVILKVDAYPVFEWGPAYGTVSNVSFTPDEKGLFNVQIRVTNPNHLNQLLRIGMQGKADITTEERSVFGHLFRKFRKTVSAVVD